MLIHFDMIHERDRQTDRRTDRQTDIRTLHDSIDRALYIASRGKNEKKRSKVVQWRRGWGGNVHLSHLLMSFLLSTWRLNCLRHMCSIGYITKISTSAFDGCVFIARQHTDARFWYSKSVCPSVRPSVRYVPVFYVNGLTHCHNFFTTRYLNHSSFTNIKHLREIPTASPLAGAINTGGV